MALVWAFLAIACQSPPSAVSYRIAVSGSARVMVEGGSHTSPGQPPDAGIVLPPEADISVTSEDTLVISLPGRSYSMMLWPDAGPIDLRIQILQANGVQEIIGYESLAHLGAEAVAEFSGGRLDRVNFQDGPGGPLNRRAKPAYDVRGAAAKDVTTPSATARVVRNAGQEKVVIMGTAGRSGVRQIWVSDDGTNFDPYSSPVPLHVTSLDVYAFVENGVGVKSAIQHFRCDESSGCAFVS